MGPDLPVQIVISMYLPARARPAKWMHIDQELSRNRKPLSNNAQAAHLQEHTDKLVPRKTGKTSQRRTPTHYFRAASSRIANK